MSEMQKVLSCESEHCEVTLNSGSTHHRQKEAVLNLQLDKASGYVTDQTPTPTRFIRNCEEVGLFQDLQEVNPFDETFKKAVELAKSGVVHVPIPSTDDTLHTPHILPHITEENSDKYQIINRVPSLDEELLKLGNKENADNVVANENASHNPVAEKHNLGFETQVSSLDVGFSISRVPSIDEDLLVIESRDSDSDGDLVVIDECLQLSEENNQPVAQNVSDNTQTVATDSGSKETENIHFEANIKVKIKEVLQNKLKTDHPKLPTNQGVIIAPVSIDKLKDAHSATLVINKKPNPYVLRPPRRRSLKNAPYSSAGQKATEGVSEKVLKIRETNRLAQLRSRARKKHWMDEIQKKIEQLNAENKALLNENQQLRSELVAVKSVLLMHKDCNVSKDPHIMTKAKELLRQVHVKGTIQQNQANSVTKTQVPIQPNPTQTIIVSPLKSKMTVELPVAVNGSVHPSTVLPVSVINPSSSSIANLQQIILPVKATRHITLG